MLDTCLVKVFERDTDGMLNVAAATEDSSGCQLQNGVVVKSVAKQQLVEVKHLGVVQASGVVSVQTMKRN